MYDIAKQVKEENISLKDLMKKKKHLVTWFASNCGFTTGARKRLNIVQTLIDTGLNVDRRLVEIIMFNCLLTKLLLIKISKIYNKL